MAEFHLPLPQNSNLTTTDEIDSSHFRANDSDEAAGDQIDGDYIAYLRYLASRSERIETYGYYDDVFGRVFGVFSPSPPPARGFNSPATLSEELPVTELTAERELSICVVCTEEFGVSDKVSELPCGHYYHKECIVPWLRTRNTCPICRHEFPADAADHGGGGAGRR